MAPIYIDENDGSGEQQLGRLFTDDGEVEAVYADLQDGNGEQLIWQRAEEIDDFEHNDLETYYNTTNSGSDPQNFRCTTEWSKSGMRSLELESGIDEDTMYSFPEGHGWNDGHTPLPNYPAPGDTIVLYLKIYEDTQGYNDNANRFRLFFGTQGIGGEGIRYTLAFTLVDPQHYIDQTAGSGYSGVDSGFAGYHDYGDELRVEIDWETDGTITVNIYDDTDDSQFGETISGTETVGITQGGIGIEQTTQGPEKMRLDDVKIT